MSVFTYSRTSICQDVASLVNKMAFFVVLDGGRSRALLPARKNGITTLFPYKSINSSMVIQRRLTIGRAGDPKRQGPHGPSPFRNDAMRCDASMGGAEDDVRGCVITRVIARSIDEQSVTVSVDALRECADYHRSGPSPGRGNHRHHHHRDHHHDSSMVHQDRSGDAPKSIDHSVPFPFHYNGDVTQQSERKGRGQNGLPSQKVAVTKFTIGHKATLFLY